jgi:hypothetical protein
MAHDLLRLYLDDTSESPVLTDDELDEILAKVDGEFYGAVSEGWTVKAGKVASWYDASLDGSNLSRDQVFDHCIQMAEMYGSRGGVNMKNIGLTTQPASSESSEMA